jgi:hypothetical protein
MGRTVVLACGDADLNPAEVNSLGGMPARHYIESFTGATIEA